MAKRPKSVMALPTAQLFEKICDLNAPHGQFAEELLVEIVGRPDCSLEQAFNFAVSDFASNGLGQTIDNRLWDKGGAIHTKFSALSFGGQLAAAKDVYGWFDDDDEGTKAQERLLSWTKAPKNSYCQRLLKLVYPYPLIGDSNESLSEREEVVALIRALELLDRSPYP